MEEEKWFNEAAQNAKQSPCLKAKCGAVIVANGEIIGRGFNSPAGNEPNRCLTEYVIPKNNKHDITCCVHAEVRAIHDALSNHPDKIKSSTLYFMRVNKDDQNTFAGVPFCTICSKEALDAGIKSFGLWHESGIRMYDTQEYNELSYQFFKDANLWPLK